MSLVTVEACAAYDLDGVRQRIHGLLAPFGGMRRFVRPGMRVLVKPNLVSASDWERAITTHPSLVRAVVDLVQEAGGDVVIGDSPGGPIQDPPPVWRRGGMVDIAEQTGARLALFESVTWERLNGDDYFVASPFSEVDLVINVPKLKTHMLTLYTGAIKNLFGAVPGTRKRQLHLRAPGVPDFSRILVDLLDLTRPALTIMDGVWGQEGDGPGARGTPHHYGCLLASPDPVALDAVLVQAMGYRVRDVLHVVQASERGLGTADLEAIQIQGDRRALDFGSLNLPRAYFFLRVPSWISAPLRQAIRIRPALDEAACAGCGRCVEVCPPEIITAGHPPRFDLDRCIACFCCAEICPQGAISMHRNWVARLAGVGI
ncbi:MAG TPA: DUF362 domain-containing protein [Chloroflexi bacterium]|nr:DUF362 domain-containing protein [Chloroflexota bacterium]